MSFVCWKRFLPFWELFFKVYPYTLCFMAILTMTGAFFSSISLYTQYNSNREFSWTLMFCLRLTLKSICHTYTHTTHTFGHILDSQKIPTSTFWKENSCAVTRTKNSNKSPEITTTFTSPIKKVKVYNNFSSKTHITIFQKILFTLRVIHESQNRGEEEGTNKNYAVKRIRHSLAK
jgi:hypothetical protein